jgi:hypothetical protein
MKNLLSQRKEFKTLFIITLVLTLLVKFFASEFMTELMILPLMSVIFLLRIFYLSNKIKNIYDTK